MKGRKKTGQNILHYVIASNVVIVFIIAILGGYLFRFYYKKMQEDFYKENSVYIGNIAKTHGNELQILQDISMQIALSDSARFLIKILLHFFVVKSKQIAAQYGNDKNNHNI